MTMSGSVELIGYIRFFRMEGFTQKVRVLIFETRVKIDLSKI